MQAPVFSLSQPLPLLKPTRSRTSGSPRKSVPSLSQSSRLRPVRAVSVPNESTSVDYSSAASVFPAEACETIGGDACAVEMFPEAKLATDAKTNKARSTSSEAVDREYYEYDGPKTVFPGEACDDLGGEFCQPDYQVGVY